MKAYINFICFLTSVKMRTKCGHGGQNKNPKQLTYNCLRFFVAWYPSRGRTGTTLLSLVFETNASTDSPSGLISASRRRSFRFQDFQSLSASKPLCLKISPHQSLSTSKLSASEPFPWPQHSHRIVSTPLAANRWTKIEKIPPFASIFPELFSKPHPRTSPKLRRNHFAPSK